MAAAAAGLALAAPMGTATPIHAPAAAGDGTAVFTAESPWNTAIGRDPVLDANSAEITATLAAGTHPAVALLYDYGTPVFDADASTPRYAIDCTAPWGTCGLERQPVTIPADARLSSGSDGQMNIIDWSTRTGYCFWQYRNDHAHTSWGGSYAVDGDGIDPTSSCNGAGVPSIAGVVRTAEMAQGRIDHALAFATRYCQAGPHRYPATKSDGKYSGSGAIPEGARVQLDPSINVDALPGATVGEKIVARALQTYGAYVTDCSGSNMSFAFENPMDKPNPYPAVGFAWDYYGMDHIPWGRLRVLQAWDSFDRDPGGSDTTAPTASITSPSNGSTVEGVVPVTVDSHDDVSVTKVELYVDGVLSGESDGGSATISWDSTGTAATRVLTAKASDAAGNVGTSAPVTVQSSSPGPPPHGLTATYIDNIDLTGTWVRRVDARVSFAWGYGAPISSIGADTFSVRWSGRVVAPTTGTYRFYTRSDDGIRLWVNGRVLVDNWTDHWLTEDSGTMSLTAGQAYDIRMEFYERGGEATAKLLWRGPGVAKSVIPSARLRAG